MLSTAGLNVTIWGDGEPVVFVHGSLGAGTETWAAPLRAAVSSWQERSPWEAEIPLDELRDAPFPELVVRGVWNVAPQAIGRQVFHAICDVLVEQLQARSATIPEAAHSVPRVGEPLNEQLRAFWRSA